MEVWQIDLEDESTVYVIAVNKNNALYKGYKKFTDEIQAYTSNEGFVEWKKTIQNMKKQCVFKVDDSRFNVY